MQSHGEATQLKIEVEELRQIKEKLEETKVQEVAELKTMQDELQKKTVEDIVDLKN